MFTRAVGKLTAASIAIFAMLTTQISATAQSPLSNLAPGSRLATGSILIEFSSDHCRACEAMKPTIAQLENSGIPVRHVNVRVEPDLARRYGIAQTPTFVVLSGGRETARLVGAQTPDQLSRALSVRPAGPLKQTRATINTQPQTRLAATAGARSTHDESHPLPPQPNPVQQPPPPTITIEQAIAKAQAATVRLKVHDDHGFGAGTGTIIDTHDGEALVMTCGHLFRDTKGQGKIDVELFVNGQVQTIPGKVVDYDAGDRDIALVAIKPGAPVPTVKVIGTNELPQTGQAVFSFGCDHGDDPSRHDSRITGVNKYNQHIDASNLEIAGAPVDGRSGGGLFDSQGRLIGVCNAADYKADIGLYTGPGSIHWQLDRIQLSRLYKNNDPVPAMAEPPSPKTTFIQAPQNPTAMAPLPANRNRGQINSAVVQASAVQPVNPPTAGGQEIIVVVRDSNSPNQNRVMNISQPSPELMALLQAQAN